MASTPRPRLTFACELDSARLTALFSDTTVIPALRELGASIALMLSDLSVERAAVVRQLNAAGIPVVAIPLVSLEEGYYFTADNADRATARFEEWKAWTAEHKLVWARVGLDIEPEARFYLQLMDNPWGLLPMLFSRVRDKQRPLRARAAYAELVERIHRDGYTVENYQFPLLADERWAGSTLLQRLFGLVDVRTDDEVWMLYTSVLPGIGSGLLWSYAPEAQAVAVGSTGGGPDIPGHPTVPALNWDAFARDLRLARRWCDDLYIHSLEGCVRQVFLSQLRTFEWDQAVAPPTTAWLAARLRDILRGCLWASAHPRRVLAITGAVAVPAVLAAQRAAARLAEDSTVRRAMFSHCHWVARHEYLPAN